jgi:tRNA pseudouridine55 synthase
MLHHGFLVIDKPEGITSHDVVHRLRRLLGFRRIGHLGTLDPLATGVLPLAIGKATRLIQYLEHDPKVYTGRMRLGFATSTYDREGEPLSEAIVPQVSPETILEAAQAMTGPQLQVPPAFSAKKLDGKRSYALARRGETVEMRPQSIRIDRFSLMPVNLTELDFEIVCSPGTYVRSVVHDLGKKLGCGAHLWDLRRIRSGKFSLDQAVTFEQIEQVGLQERLALLLAPKDMLRHLPELEVPAELYLAVSHGCSFDLEGDFAVPGESNLFRMIAPGGELLGLAEQVKASDMPAGARFHPKLVL